jgi:hypothetical protein
LEGAELRLSIFRGDYIQGYFLGQPITMAKMEEVLRSLRNADATEEGSVKSVRAG